ncbi:MAG: FAD-binding protein, partial [Clostridia bacterium]|nr:FAD-binding protein [Clostridia bacterium]
IHFFMGGVKVDSCHRTDIKYLYAAGECACIYHGANRLGGNSLLGAAFGGTLSANTALKEYASFAFSDPTKDALSPSDNETILRDMTVSPSFNRKLKEALLSGLGIVREKMTMQTALSAVESLRQTAATATERARADLAKAMLLSALFRKESRGAHYRTDYPDASEDYRKTTVSVLSRGEPEITFVSIDEDSAREKGDYIYD